MGHIAVKIVGRRAERCIKGDAFCSCDEAGVPGRVGSDEVKVCKPRKNKTGWISFADQSGPVIGDATSTLR